MKLSKIETGVPLPERRNQSGVTKGLLSKMKVGNSVLFHGTMTGARMAGQRAWGKGKSLVRKEGKFVRLWRAK